ncbi:C-reactive protein-like isoform X1 [Paramormyrops kingsleyae]|uniref:C-reactive protein-like isoform X1 n=1 Tax=Paramormyrops kingsleyae TaxID=1676925 RepID=UPI000CD662AD|nr:C-reactive protein-like isoform X1 [Paramormyrops kingsleyae]
MKGLLFYVLYLIIGSYAEREDLSGKAFTFPKQTATDYVKITLDDKTSLTALTVCLRFFTDLSQEFSIFSMATLTHHNAFLLYKEPSGVYGGHINNLSAKFFGLPVEVNEWISTCMTWNSKNRLIQLWVNGKHSVKKPVGNNAAIHVPAIITLGQEQDSYGGGFNAHQSFVGDITDVHMWDHALSPCQIQNYITHASFSPGNVISWKALEYVKQGSVTVEDIEINTCEKPGLL